MEKENKNGCIIVVVILIAVIAFIRISDYREGKKTKAFDKHSQLALSYLNNGDLNNALKEYQIAEGYDIQKGSVILSIAEIYIKQGKYEEAILYYDKYLKKDAKNVDVNLDKGIALYLNKEYDKAETINDRVLQHYSSPDSEFIIKGFIQLKKGNIKKCIKNFTEAINNSYYNLRAENNNGLIYSAGKNYSHALQAFENATRFDNKQFDKACSIVLSYIYENDVTKNKIEMHDRIIKMHKIKYTAYNNYIQTLLALGRKDEAIMKSEEIYHADSIDIRATKLLGDTYLLTQNAPIAIRYYSKALKKDTINRDVLINIGIAFRKNKEFQKAIGIYSKILYHYQNDYMAYNNLASVYLDILEIDSAIHYQKKATELYPYDPVMFLRLGDLYKDKKDIESQKICYRRAAKMGFKQAQDWLKERKETW